MKSLNSYCPLFIFHTFVLCIPLKMIILQKFYIFRSGSIIALYDVIVPQDAPLSNSQVGKKHLTSINIVQIHLNALEPVRHSPRPRKVSQCESISRLVQENKMCIHMKFQLIALQPVKAPHY